MSGKRRNRFAGDQWRIDRVRTESPYPTVRNRRWRKFASALYAKVKIDGETSEFLVKGIFRRAK